MIALQEPTIHQPPLGRGARQIGSSVLALSFGIFALVVALIAALAAFDFVFLQPDDVTLIFNGHRVGGTFDTAVSIGIAVVFGVAGWFLMRWSLNRLRAGGS